MAPNFVLDSDKAILAAGYQPAAILSPCRVSRTQEVLSQDYSRFSGTIQRVSEFWMTQITHLCVCVGDVFWVWPVIQFSYNLNPEGKISGDPTITRIISPSVRAWV